jgi:hypothetical protein
MEERSASNDKLGEMRSKQKLTGWGGRSDRHGDVIVMFCWVPFEWKWRHTSHVLSSDESTWVVLTLCACRDNDKSM